MTDPIVYIDHSSVRPGKSDEVARLIEETVESLELLEPQLLQYGFYLDEERSRMTVVAIHPDAASVELHMDVGGPLFQRFSDCIDLERIEIYGEPSDRMLEQLHQKARSLGSGDGVIVDSLQAGFSRIS